MYDNTPSPQTSRISVRRSTPISQSCGHRRQRTFKRNAPRWTNNATRFWRTSPQSTRAWKRCVEQKRRIKTKKIIFCVFHCVVCGFMCVFYIILLCLTLYILSRVQKIIIHTLDVCWCFESCLWRYVLGLLNDLMTWRRWVEMTSNESVTHLRQGCGRLQEQCLQGTQRQHRDSNVNRGETMFFFFFSALQL